MLLCAVWFEGIFEMSWSAATQTHKVWFAMLLFIYPVRIMAVFFETIHNDTIPADIWSRCDREWETHLFHQFALHRWFSLYLLNLEMTQLHPINTCIALYIQTEWHNNSDSSLSGYASIQKRIRSKENKQNDNISYRILWAFLVQHTRVKSMTFSRHKKIK